MDGLLTELSAAILPALVALFGTVATIIINRASKVAQERWGIEIEARHREALQSALMSGIRAALSRGLSGDAAIRAAIHHAGSSVPDAITALNPASGVLKSIAEAKLREVMDGAFPMIVAQADR
ncbi:hypothetical protein [Paracoccus denitrificans]|uniref:hypothetical protein n=1 Tax=Paracoccus denitrificans TaxID=266 RepID=UPI003364B900